MCKDHANRCTKSGCSGLTANSVCPEHECAAERCIQPRAGRGDRCRKHGCTHVIQPDGVSVPCGNVRVGKADYCSEHLCGEPGCRALHAVGPYCREHGCEQRLENGFCGNDLKQHSYHCKEHACAYAECVAVRERGGEYCVKHTCATGGCMEWCAEISKHCVEHECSYGGCRSERGVKKFCNVHGCIIYVGVRRCGEERRNNSSYCEMHVCAQKSCLEARHGQGECCVDHGCVHQDGGVICCAMKAQGSDHCADHSCTIAGCGYPRDGKMCCRRHGCRHVEPGQKEKCGIERKTSSIYCLDHACVWSGCWRHRGDGRLCGRHGCAFKGGGKAYIACGVTRKDGLRWCAEHACMWDGCKSSNNGDGRCCSEHGCVREVSGVGRCGEPRITGREMCARHARQQQYGQSVDVGKETSARADPAPATDKAAQDTPYEAVRPRLERRLAESGLACEVFRSNGPTWDDVVGLNDVKDAIRTAMVYPLQEPELPEGTWANGILLFGPSGTGKTLVAKATASEIGGLMVSIDSATMSSKWVGESEKNVAALFRIVTEYADETGRPVVLFMDEVDALLGSYEQEADWTARMNAEFQTRMNNIKAEKKKVCVMGTTNRPDRIADPFLRRFQKRIRVKMPSAEDREKLFRLYAGKFEVADDVDFGRLAGLFIGYSSSDIKTVCEDALNETIAATRSLSGRNAPGSASDGRRRPISMEDFREVHNRVRASVSQDDELYEKWEKEYGSS